MRISVRDISKILRSREDIKLEERVKVLEEEMKQIREIIGGKVKKKSMDEIMSEVFTNISDLLDLAEKGIDPRKVEWDIAHDTLNIYLVKLKCPWCGRVSYIEYFTPILD
ncbi:MAG: hypothetical protein QXG12_08275 [Thermoproteota archaeon]